MLLNQITSVKLTGTLPKIRPEQYWMLIRDYGYHATYDDYYVYVHNCGTHRYDPYKMNIDDVMQDVRDYQSISMIVHWNHYKNDIIHTTNDGEKLAESLIKNLAIKGGSGRFEVIGEFKMSWLKQQMAWVDRA